MRLALVDVDTELIRFLLSDQASNPAQFVAFVEDSQRSKLHELERCGHELEFRRPEEWQSAVNEQGLTAILVGGQPANMEKLRFFTQAGVAVLVRHPAGTMVDGFQLQMIQRDTGAQIQPFHRGIHHPMFEILRKWCDSEKTSPLGSIQQTILVRSLDSTEKSEVLRAFTQDVFWLRFVLGQIDRVSAIGVESLNQQDWSHLSVQMVGSGGVVGRWTPWPASAGQPSRLELVGQLGMAIADLEGDPGHWGLRVVTPVASQVELPQWNGATATLARLHQAVVERDPVARHQIDEDWENACRAVEIADSVEQSCRRGKTIELFHEEHTEEATFKGVMAAGGCLLLVLILMFMIGLQVVSTVRPEIGGWTGWSFVWKFVVLIMTGFLGLQLLRLVFSKKSGAE